jgi:hypothetical protein
MDILHHLLSDVKEHLFLSCKMLSQIHLSKIDCVISFSLSFLI